MVLTWGLIAMCIGLTAGLFTVILPRLAEPTRVAAFLRMTALSGVLSVGSGAMYVVRQNGGGRLSLVVADTAMVLAPAILCVALRPPRGRPFAPTVVVAVVVGMGMAACSALSPAETSTTVRFALLGIVSALCAVLAVRSISIPRTSMRVLGATMAAYAVFALARAIVGVVDGPSALSAVFTPTTTTAAPVLVMLLAGLSVVLVGAPAIRVRSSQASRRTRVAIGDWDLAAAAYGTDRVMALLVELRFAAQDLDPTAVDATHGVETSLPRAGAALRAHMRDVYRWKPEEVQLIVDVGSGLPRRAREDA